jgi:tetratricopeptide (TPR) repeat protein
MEPSEHARWVFTAHRDYYLWLAEQANAAWRTSALEQWLARLQAEDANLQAALEWSRAQPDGAEALARLTVALKEYWEYLGRFSEGRQWMDRVLDERDRVSVPARINLLMAAAQFANYLGDFEQSGTLLDECLALAREHGDAYGEALTISHLGYRAQTKGDTPAAQSLHSQGLALWQALGDPDHVADSLTNLGFAALLSGDVPHSLELFEQSVALCRNSSKRFFLADALLALGFVRFLAGQPDVASGLLAEGLSLAHTLGMQPLIARGLEEVAFAAGMSGAAEHAARILGATEALRERIGVPMPQAYRGFYDQLLAAVHAALSADALASAWAAGRLLGPDEAVALALDAAGQPSPPA